MSEFSIKVKVDLDASDIEGKLKALGENQNIKLNVDSSDLNKIESQLKGLKASFQDAFKFDKGFINDVNKLADALKKLNNLPGGNSPNSPSKPISSLVNDYKELSNIYSKLQKEMNSGKLGESALNRTKQSMVELQSQMKTLYSQMDERSRGKVDLLNAQQMNKDILNMHSYMSKIESQATSLGTKLNSISFNHIDDSKINRITNELEEIQNKAKQDIDLNFDVGDILSDLNRLSSEIKNLEKVENLASSFDKISGSIKDAGGDVENFANSIKELENSADRIDGSFDKAFKKANDGLKDMQSTAKKMSSDTKGKGLLGSIFGSKEDFLGNFSSFTLAEIAGDFISDGLRQMAGAWKDTVVETDAAMTDLRKVYDKNLTGDNLKGYLNSVTEVAKGTGKSSVDVIQGTAKAVQSGIKDIDDALVFARQSAIFSNVGDVDQSTADTVLAATMSAYGGVENALKPVREQIVGAGKDYNTLTKFMDLANYAGNNFAISTADVGEALQLSAAALKTNGVSMEESVGMITAMNEVTQNASKTGNALKSISSNMAGVSTSAKDGTIQTNKTAKALKEIAGIDVWNKQTGEIKDMYSVMEELNGKWGDLSEAQQNALATTIAGKTQLNAFNALMSNWGKAKQLVSDYKDGLTVGSAEKENAQYLDSIAGKWNVIKENMKAAGNSLITSDMAKNALDVGIVLSEGLSKGTSLFTKGISETLNGTIGKTFSDNIYGMFEKAGLIGNNGIMSKIFTSLSSGLGGYFGKISETMLGFTKTGKLLNQFKNISDKLFGDMKLDKQIDERNQNVQAIESEVNALKSQQEALKELSPRYDELSKKSKRSAKENQELAELRNQLAETNPDLVLGYDQNGTPILKNLDIQNKQLESQIRLKQQAQRLEENSLALDTLQKQTLGQKEFNKAYKEYNDMQLASDTKRKKGLFSEESTQDYAKRIIDDNKKIAEANQEAYEQRLKDHQQYVQDEQAIQQKYMNEMTQKTSFNRLTDEAKQGMLKFMDALDWSQFSPAEGSQFAGMLANLGDKLVPTTEAMGKQSKAIAQLTQDYANGKTNLINYTKGLTEQYEAAGKFDSESFSAWRQGLQSYVDTTGDLQGANKAIEGMATSLNKITGIKTDTWKTALSFDPAPIDASNKALQKFLNSYGTGVQNMGKGGMADKLTSQFETLQNSYTQMTSDLASGKEIDVEYLVNAKVNQPEPIASLIDEIVSDNKVTEQEIDLLLTAQAEILNTGEISDETIKQIADEFNMTEEEVRLMLNVKTEVKEEGEPLEEVKSKWESIDIGEKILSLVQKVTGGELVESAKSAWDSMDIGEKIQTLVQMVTGGDLLGSAAQLFAGINVGQKIQELLQKVTGSDLVKSAGEWFSSLSVGQKIQELLQRVTGSDLVKSAGQWFNSLNVGQKIQELIQMVSGGDLLKSAAQSFMSISVGQKIQELLQRATGSDLVKSAASFFSGIFQGTKNQTLEQKATGSDAVKEASNAMESLPSVKQVTISFIQSGKGLLDSISGFFKSKTEEKVSVSVQVTGKEQIESIKSSIASLQNKNINVNVNAGNATSLLNNIKSALNSMQTKTINVNLSGNALSQVNQIKSALNGLQTKNISINASGNALSQINSIKSALGGLQSKSISVNASVNGVGQVNALKSSIAGLQGKSVSVTASTSGVGQVNALTSAIGRVQGKSVSVTANVSGTGAVNALNSAISRVKSKSVKISASVSGTGAVQGLASAIANVRSKSVSVSASVTKTVTTVEKTVAQSVPVSVSTPMLINTSLADIPVSASSPLDIPISASDNISPLASVPVSISAKANNDFGGTIDRDKILSMLDFNVSHIKDLTEALERLGNQLNFLDEKSEAVFGKEKVNLLEQQIPLLREQQKIQEQIAKNERAQNNELTNWLSNKGFTFDNLGNITNYQDKLLSMEQNVDSLKKKYDALNDAKDKNEDATKSAQKAYEDANEALSKTKDYLEEYFTTNNKEIIEASKKWWEYENQIREVESAIREVLNLELQRQIDAISDSIDFLDAKIDMMNSNDKIQYLEEQNRLYKEQQTLLHVLAQQMRTQLATLNPLSDEYADLASEIMGLSEKWWDLQSAISKNQSSIFESRTNGLRNQLENLEDEIGFLDSKSDSYNGDNKINILEQQVGLYKEQQNQLHQLANELRYQLTLLDPQSEEYHEIASEIKKLSTEWWDVEKAIRDATDSVEEMKRELKLVTVDSALTELEVKFARLNFELDLIDEKMDYVWGTDKIDAMTESVSLLTKELDMQQEKLGLTNKKMAIYQEDLLKYGFQFDKMGNMTNYSSMMEIYKNGTEFDKLIDMTKEYMDLQEELQDLTLGYWEIDKKIKDTYKEQLEITQDIEDKITDIYEKEYDKRKKEIEDFTDERIKLLNKEKDAYKSLREEQDYNKSVKEQTDEIEKLNKLIETARRDTSIGGQKRLKELMEQLAEAQEKLQETTQDKIDSDYESNIDNEIDRLEEEQDKLIGILDEKFSDENIAKMVAEAMANGFIEINGEVKSLQDALLQSINESADAYSVMAQVIKNELVTNLNVALESMKELDNIYSNLGLNDYEGISSNVKTNMLTPSYSGNNSKNVTIGDTYLTISGNVSDDILEEIEQMIDKKNEKMLNEITANL